MVDPLEPMLSDENWACERHDLLSKKWFDDQVAPLRYTIADVSFRLPEREVAVRVRSRDISKS
ncbi:MAG: hypothetical protein HYX47_00275 [Burkholderiales bacterium]|nr:hypothetical protein [Burkholderiales bacterium]